MAWDDSAPTWHPYICNPEVWAVDVAWGNLYHGHWDSTDRFFYLPPWPSWTICNFSDYIWSLRKHPEWQCNQISRKLWSSRWWCLLYFFFCLNFCTPQNSICAEVFAFVCNFKGSWAITQVYKNNENFHFIDFIVDIYILYIIIYKYIYL